jgi:predicted nucleic acid-binding protein
LIPAGLFLVDTSAIARASNQIVLSELVKLGELGLLATCVTIDLEVLYSARSPKEYLQISSRRVEGFLDYPVNPEIGKRARSVQAELARRSQHRSCGMIDLLTAATAEHYGATVLHYDSDFENISTVTRQPTQWVVPRGSVN